MNAYGTESFSAKSNDYVLKATDRLVFIARRRNDINMGRIRETQSQSELTPERADDVAVTTSVVKDSPAQKVVVLSLYFRPSGRSGRGPNMTSGIVYESKI